MAHRVEDYFPPAFYKNLPNGKFEAFALDPNAARYNSIGVFEFEATAERVVHARTVGFCNARAALGKND